MRENNDALSYITNKNLLTGKIIVIIKIHHEQVRR